MPGIHASLPPLHVAVDLDDVTVDFLGSLLKMFELEYGVTPEYDGAPWGGKAAAFARHPLFHESGYEDWWDWLRDREWLWALFPAVPGAIGGIKRLRADGNYIEAVTTKPEWAEHDVWKWLGKWRPPFNAATIVPPGVRKLDRTQADVIVDDKLGTCEEFAQAGRFGVWLDRRTITVPHWRRPRRRLLRAENWEEVVRFVRAIRLVKARRMAGEEA